MLLNFKFPLIFSFLTKKIVFFVYAEKMKEQKTEFASKIREKKL